MRATTCLAEQLQEVVLISKLSLAIQNNARAISVFCRSSTFSILRLIQNGGKMYQDKIIKFAGKNKKQRTQLYKKEAQALKAIRISKGIKREDVAEYLGCAKFTVERIENGRLPIDDKKIASLLRRYRLSKEDFNQIIEGHIKIPSRAARSVYKTIKHDPKTYRRYRIEISKEARVLRIMRKMKKLSKPKAAKLCGVHPSCIDHRENGRTNITKEDIKNLVSGYGFKMSDFNELMEQPIIRDEVVEECISILQTIETDKLNAVRALLINFK